MTAGDTAAGDDSVAGESAAVAGDSAVADDAHDYQTRCYNSRRTL